MLLGKSLSLSAHNWKVLLKTIVCQTIIYFLMVALCSMVLGGLIADIIAVLRDNQVADFISQTLRSIAEGTFNSTDFSNQLSTIISQIQSDISALSSNWGSAEFPYIIAFVVFVIYRTLIAITDVATDCQIAEFMTSNAERPFLWYFVKKQGKSWAFSLLQTLIVLPLDLLILFGCLGFYLVFMVSLRWWAIIPVAAIAILLIAVRITFFAFTLPSVVVNDNMLVKDAFREGLSKIFASFGSVFWKTLLIVIVEVAIFVVSLLYVTDNFWLTVLPVVPNFILIFIQKNVNLCEYFHAEQKPYFYKRVDIEGTDRFERKRKRELKRLEKAQK